MTFGRPTMLSKSWKVPVPLLIDDEHLSVDGTGVQPPDIPSRLGLFVSSCELFEILHDILATFYVDESGADSSKQLHPQTPGRDIITDVLSFNRRLDEFVESIPEYLHVTEISQVIVSEKNTCIHLQQQVLYCRYIPYP
jgi:hypothetical protein